MFLRQSEEIKKIAFFPEILFWIVMKLSALQHNKNEMDPER